MHISPISDRLAGCVCSLPTQGSPVHVDEDRYASCTCVINEFQHLRMLTAVECCGDSVPQLSEDHSAGEPRQCAGRPLAKAQGGCPAT